MNINRVLNKYVGNLVVLMAVASYFELFKFTSIPYTFRIISQILTLGIIVLLILLRVIYNPEKGIKMHFAGLITLLMLGSLPSYFVAHSAHGQNLAISFYANRIIWFYLLYFFVHLYKIDVRFILRVIILTGLFAVALYYIQFSIYPAKIMDIGMFKDRGTIRFFVPGLICSTVAYFYFLNNFFSRNKLMDLLFCLLILGMFILQGARSLLFSLVFLTLLNLLFAKRVRSKLLITIVLTMSVFTAFLLFREIFIEMQRVSVSQVRDFSGGIRLKAAKFFLTDFMPNGWAYIFGNSTSDTGSLYDQKVILYADIYHYYLSDIGVVGDYVKFGVIFILAGLAMLIKSILFKTEPRFRFLKYYILAQCFTLITGKGILSGVDINLVMILYIFDVSRSEALSQTNPAVLSDDTPDNNMQSKEKIITIQKEA